MKQKLFSLWLLLSVAVGLSAFKVDGLYYEITDQDSNTVAVTGYAYYSDTIKIPETITYNGFVYNVTSIGWQAFMDCSSLISVTIGNGVTSIGGEAFYDCRNLTSITIPNSVTSIGRAAFSYCRGLTSITIPNSVTRIGNSTFSGCTRLTSITIPNSVTSIGYQAFYGCTGLTSVTIGNGVTSIGEKAFSGCTGLTSVTIGNSVTSIGDEAFYGCTGLTSVTIGNSVTSIGWQVFDGCTGLTSVTIGNSVTSIKNGVFRGCNSLTSVTWNAKACSDFYNENTPFYDEYLKFDIRSQITSFTFGDSVQSIPAYLCSGMKNIPSVTIPNSVMSIGYSAFRGCTGLTKVNYIGDVKGWLAIDMNSNPISYSHNLYINNKLVTDLVIPEGTTDISSNLAQYTGLTSITIPNSVISISGSAFSGCKNVETVVFGSAVETIGASAFAGCQSIYEMTIYATKVPTIQENTFAGVGTGATLRVPAGCAKKYKAHPYWGVFNIEEIPSEYTITVTCDPKQGQVTGGGTYTDGSKVSLTATPNDGYEFKQWSDGSTANPYSFLVEKDVTIEALFEPTTPIENVVAEEHIAPRKVFRDGQVYILRGGKTYTLTGVEINL